jgi:pyridoxal phosphate enzyme (YggS family)
MNKVVDNYQLVMGRLAHAAEEFGLPPQPVPTLIVVTKNRSVEEILPLLEAGHRDFGENKVQEMHSKWPVLKEKYPDIVLHLIGPLQSNKTKEALALCDVLHTLDRESLVESVLKYMQPNHRFFVQVNTGNEPQKAGIPPLQAPEFIEKVKAQLGKNLQGLMCIPPVAENPAPHFGLLKLLSKNHKLQHLSMGMSSDYLLAAAMGATHVRVGSAIFAE